MLKNAEFLNTTAIFRSSIINPFTMGSVLIGVFLMVFVAVVITVAKTPVMRIETPVVIRDNDLKKKLLVQEISLAQKTCGKNHMHLKSVYNEHLQGTWTTETDWTKDINQVIIFCVDSEGYSLSHLSLMTFAP